MWQLPPPKPQRSTPPNPRPVGALLPSGATAQVLFAMAQQPQRFWSHGELSAKLLQPKSLTWSLRYARLMGWVETTADHRSARYLRYRITAAGLSAFSGG